jgi:hypothetical protein
MVVKSAGRQILWASEMIISLRVLLFSIPVIINQYTSHTFSLSNVDDRYMVLLSWTAVIYFMVGMVSYAGFTFWKAVHYLAVVLIGLLTFGSLDVVQRLSASPGVYYYVPFLCSIFVAMLAGASRGTTRTA